jgi:hypothetical protein
MLRSLVVLSIIAGSAAIPIVAERESKAPSCAVSALASNCEMSSALTFPTWNILCAGGASDCVSVTIVGSTPGNDGACPTNSCQGPSFTLTVTYNGCAPAANCCSGNIDVLATGQAARNVAVGANTTLTVGGDKPGCPGLNTTTLIIQCAGGGTILLQANLSTQCAGC